MKRYTAYRTPAAAMLLLALLLSACSADDVLETSSRDGEIRLSVGGNDKWITRAALVTNGTDIQSKDISLTAVMADDTKYLDNKKLAYNAASSGWEFDTKYYWPPASLSFYARLPYTDANMTDATFGATPGFKYTIPEESGNHHDLMYAVIKNQEKTDNTLALNMKHALAAVSFLAKTESAQMEVIISGIDFCNVKTTATFTYPAASTAAAPAGDHANCWSDLGTVATLKAGIDEITLDNTAEKQVNTSGGVMMLIPQELTAWDRSGKATDQTGSYVVIHCSMKFNGAYIVGGDGDTDGLIYVPYGGNFEAGYHYKTSMTFGLGFGDDGKTLKPVVKLTASIADWTTATDNNEDKPIYPHH